MAKKITYKAGSKKRHDSLYYSVAMSHDEAIELSKKNIKTIPTEIEKHIEWLKGVIADNQVNPRFRLMDISEENVNDLKPIVIAALNALEPLEDACRWSKLIETSDASKHSKMGTWRQISQNLLIAMHNMLFVQEALHETAILDLKKRSKPIREKAQHSKNLKEKLIELCKPQYNEIKERRPDFNNSDIARKLSTWLWDEHKIPRSESTLRKWIKQM